MVSVIYSQSVCTSSYSLPDVCSGNNYFYYMRIPAVYQNSSRHVCRWTSWQLGRSFIFHNAAFWMRSMSLGDSC
jgi:hypothetical protein